jgi:hypothetical protein
MAEIPPGRSTRNLLRARRRQHQRTGRRAPATACRRAGAAGAVGYAASGRLVAPGGRLPG